MTRKGLVDRIFQSQELMERPPIVVDIGASGEIHPSWRMFARYAVGVVFDADARETAYLEKADSGFRRLHVVPALVAERRAERVPFFFTRSPYCSSSLQPDHAALLDWSFAELFEVERTAELAATDLPSVLADLNLDRVDWFKSDSQGTDLRLFRSLGADLCRRALVAEFEPGIIDAYSGEDKLHDVLRFMDDLPFWVARMEVRGAQRINVDRVKSLFDPGELENLRAGRSGLPESPGWAEITFLNSLEGAPEKRTLLLALAFAIVLEQLGFALEVALRGRSAFGEALFDTAIDALKHAVKSGNLRAMKNRARNRLARLLENL
jgi:hypothetical protein